MVTILTLRYTATLPDLPALDLHQLQRGDVAAPQQHALPGPRRRLNAPTSREGHSGNGQPSHPAPIMNQAVAQKTWLPGSSRSHGLHLVLTTLADGLCALVW